MRIFVVTQTLALLLSVWSPRAAAVGPTYGSDNGRTGWYPDQPGLDPAQVTGPAFGQLFRTGVSGQVYAQPLVWNGILLVATETNDLYGLDAGSGAVLWSRRVEEPWNAADLGCLDLGPTVGVTGTPVVDPGTGTAYLFAKSYRSGSSGPAKYAAHALDLTTGEERPGFPVTIEGSPTNDPGIAFDATYELQRPGLLLLDGVVYAGFGSHCMYGPYHGFVAGVSTSGRLTTLWSTTPRDLFGASIWQSGGGIVSDGPGRLFVVTGNGGGPASPSPGTAPPANLGQSAIRLDVQAGGGLVPGSFFTPFDAPRLDDGDLDFGSGGPVALPRDPFGVAGHSDLLLAGGKDGALFLLDRNDLGGCRQGPGGTDAVLLRTAPVGGIWTKPAVWPGDGGWIWFPTASPDSSSVGSTGRLNAFRFSVDPDGRPALTLAAASPMDFGFGTGAPVITSTGTNPGTALVWIVWSPDRNGLGAELRAYDAEAPDGVPALRFRAPISQATKFAAPGVGEGRIYVGARDGGVYGFGVPRDGTHRSPGIDPDAGPPLPGLRGPGR